MEKKIITDRERIAKLKERRSFLNDQVKSLTREVSALKKELRAEQFVNGSFRCLIYRKSPLCDTLQITTLMNWVESLLRDKQAIEDIYEEERMLNFDKMLKKFRQRAVKGVFLERGTHKLIKEVQWVYSEN